MEINLLVNGKDDHKNVEREGLFIIKRTLTQHCCGGGGGATLFISRPRQPHTISLLRGRRCLPRRYLPAPSLRQNKARRVRAVISVTKTISWSHGFIRLSSVQTANQRPDPDPGNTLFVEGAINKQKRDHTQDDNVSETN